MDGFRRKAAQSVEAMDGRAKLSFAENQELRIMKTTPNLKEIALILKAHFPSKDYRAVLFGSRV